MATLLEIAQIKNDPRWGDFRRKVIAATMIKAFKVGELLTPLEAQVDWAKGAVTNPVGEADKVVHYTIAANSTVSITQILTANDNVIQSAVDSAVDSLLGT